MKKCSNKKVKKCNKKTNIKCSVVTITSVRSRSTVTVSIELKKQRYERKKGNFKSDFFENLKELNNARCYYFFYLILVLSLATTARSEMPLWQYLSLRNNNNQRFKKFFNFTICETLRAYYQVNYKPTVKNKSYFDESKRILLCGDVERNPGPDYQKGVKPPGKETHSSMEVVTYNCRGLKDYKKLKRVLNTCSTIVKSKPLSIILLQETHLDSNSIKKVNVMWRGKYASSPGAGGSRGCLTLFDNGWSVTENFESLDGRIICTALTNEQVSVIVINAYSPNDHNVPYFETLFDKLIEFKDKYPDYSVIMAGDFNLIIDPANDAINRVDTSNERVSRQLVSDNLRVLELSDAFRRVEEVGGFTWNRGKTYSRLDYVLVSSHLLECVSNANTDWAFDKSDHAAVKIHLKIPKANARGPGLVRVNAEVLNKDHIRTEFLGRLRQSIDDIPANWDPNQRLEFLKVITRSTLSEIVGREKRIEDKEQEAISEQLNRLKNNQAECLKRNILVPGVSEAIVELQAQVDTGLKIKAEKLAMRAKCKWFDEGEKSNKYFLNLLKRRKNETTLKELNDGREVAHTQAEIEAIVVKFYSNLYSEDNTLKNDYDSFFPELPQLNEEDRRMLDEPITLKELLTTLKDCSESSPGPDGIPYLVYKKCWEVFGPFILESWLYSRAKGILPDFNKVSTIMLIPKEGKDPKQIGNWRPITLTNCDLKIFTKLLSNRVAKVLPKIILKSQVAYIPGRVVHDNLRMFEFFNSYCTENDIDAVLISLDAAKAFDSVDHNYMFETLKRYGFSIEFIDTVRMLYNDIRADILVNGYRTTMIRIRRCVKQGDALSCALFIICLDPVLRNIENNKKIKAIKLKTPISNVNIESKTGAYADDVGAAILNEEESINGIFSEYGRFSSYSGIRLNETKSEILSLNTKANFIPTKVKISSEQNAFELTTVEKIKICGITFSCNKDLAYKANVVDKIDKMESNLIAWLHRGLLIPGKIVIVNTFGLSQLIYSMQMCEYREPELKRIDNMIFKFLWNKKWYGNRAPDRIKREVLKRDYKGGGLKVPDVSNINKALKLRQFLRSIKSDHPISNIQSFVTERLDYDLVYQQEYSRVTKLEKVTEVAQNVINGITDKTREVDCQTVSVLQADLIAGTDVYEYLSRKKAHLPLCYFKRLYALGIERFAQLHRELRFPRNDEILKIAKIVIASFPEAWQNILLSNVTDDEINLTENFPVLLNRGKAIEKVTVKDIKRRLSPDYEDNYQFPFNVKLGITNHVKINPFLVAKQVNLSIGLRFFKYRLLQGDIYTKERMFRFKMVSDNNCDYCGGLEDVRHLMWECGRVRGVWRDLQGVFTSFDPRGEIGFESLFIGYSPTNFILESLLTRVTRSIISRERTEQLSTQQIKHELVEHCDLNIYSLKSQHTKISQWKAIKGLLETQL